MDTLSPMCSLLVPTLNAVRTKKNLVRNEVHEFQQDLMFRLALVVLHIIHGIRETLI